MRSKFILPMLVLVFIISVKLVISTPPTPAGRIVYKADREISSANDVKKIITDNGQEIFKKSLEHEEEYKESYWESKNILFGKAEVKKDKWEVYFDSNAYIDYYKVEIPTEGIGLKIKYYVSKEGGFYFIPFNPSQNFSVESFSSYIASKIRWISQSEDYEQARCDNIKNEADLVIEVKLTNTKQYESGFGGGPRQHDFFEIRNSEEGFVTLMTSLNSEKAYDFSKWRTYTLFLIQTPSGSYVLNCGDRSIEKNAFLWSLF